MCCSAIAATNMYIGPMYQSVDSLLYFDDFPIGGYRELSLALAKFMPQGEPRQEPEKAREKGIGQVLNSDVSSLVDCGPLSVISRIIVAIVANSNKKATTLSRRFESFSFMWPHFVYARYF